MKVKYYEEIKPEDMAEDPAHYAERNGLINEHNDPLVRRKIGVWRWVQFQRHRARILELVVDKYVIDLGGAAGPLGYGSVVVDYWSEHRGLWDVPPNADVVFASHVLEHFVDVDSAVAGIFHKLKPGGHLIAMVPTWHKENLQAQNWPWHEQTFKHSTEVGEWTAFDKLLGGHGFELELLEIVEQCFVCIARKP